MMVYYEGTKHTSNLAEFMSADPTIRAYDDRISGLAQNPPMIFAERLVAPRYQRGSLVRQEYEADIGLSGTKEGKAMKIEACEGDDAENETLTGARFSTARRLTISSLSRSRHTLSVANSASIPSWGSGYRAEENTPLITNNTVTETPIQTRIVPEGPVANMEFPAHVDNIMSPSPSGAINCTSDPIPRPKNPVNLDGAPQAAIRHANHAKASEKAGATFRGKWDDVDFGPSPKGLR
ncbi:hypothetical protein N0V90_003402 [Kalmusia sp. IMI 367209]|nr:hypothetical protein N0V90_003402 [Kalmusia sp. IMI 367209]